jgi:hypothetical protein
VHRINDFGQFGEFQKEWSSVAVVFIGITLKCDDDIGMEGIPKHGTLADIKVIA